MSVKNFDYQPYYCEENVWRLCGRDGYASSGDYAVFIANPKRCVAILNQRAAPLGKPVFWDYHVIHLSKRGDGALIVDLDSRLGPVIPATEYLAASFSQELLADPGDRPLFRPVPASFFRDDFLSDRSHMRDSQGNYLQAPPPWPAPGQGGNQKGKSNLLEYIDTDSEKKGLWLRLNSFFSFIDTVIRK